MADLNLPAPVEVVDARGKLCPVPIILLARTIRRREPGQVVRLLADDPGAERDLWDWTRANGHEVVEIQVDRKRRLDALVRVKRRRKSGAEAAPGERAAD